MTELQGRRLPDAHVNYAEVQPGDYWHPPDRPAGEWWFRDPAGNIGRITAPPWTVEEHEDGTLTITPSILDTGPPDPPWHGYLTRGVWRSV